MPIFAERTSTRPDGSGCGGQEWPRYEPGDRKLKFCLY